jgi:hypothetical protein
MNVRKPDFVTNIHFENFRELTNKQPYEYNVKTLFLFQATPISKVDRMSDLPKIKRMVL